MNFILLGARYFCTPINVPELVLGCQKLLWNTLMLSRLAVMVCKVGQEEVRPSRVLYPMPCELYIFPSWLVRESTVPGPMWVPGTVPSHSLRLFFSQRWAVSSYSWTEYLRGTLYKYPGFSNFHVPLSSPVCCPWPAPAMPLSLIRHAFSSIKGVRRTLPRFSFLVPKPGNPTK